MVTLFYYCTSTVILLLFYYCTSRMVCPSRGVNNASEFHWDELMETIRWHHLNTSLALPVGNLGASQEVWKKL